MIVDGLFCLCAFYGSLRSRPVRRFWEAMRNKEAETLKFGVLPVVPGPTGVRRRGKGLFQGIGHRRRDRFSFNSGMEKDVAMSAGAISGYFGDLMTPMVLRANGVPVKIVSTIFQTTPTQRMFAVLAAPGSADKSLEELIEEGIAGSSNTIIEYILHRILKSEGLPVERFTMIETKRIPIRLQMLLSNQVPAATLPEPLAAFAETKGAKVLLDDAGRGISSTVLAFREDYISERPEAVKRFHKAIDKAVEFIRENPKEARRIMNRKLPGARVHKGAVRHSDIPAARPADTRGGHGGARLAV